MHISAEATTATKTCKIKGRKRQFDDSNQKHQYPLTVTGQELIDTFDITNELSKHYGNTPPHGRHTSTAYTEYASICKTIK